jgi:hypothetical protein
MPWPNDDKGPILAHAVSASLADFALRALSAGEPFQRWRRRSDAGSP